jgi:hypothetical protein
MPHPGVPPAPGPGGFPPSPAGPAPWPPTVPIDLRRPSRWPAFVALATALIAFGLAVGGWFRPQPHNAPPPAPPAPGFTGQQIADAKTRVCAAFQTVRTAAALQTKGNDSEPLAGTANARLSLAVGSAYLSARLDPATPQPLAAAVRTLADDLLELAENALAGAMNDDPAQAQRLHNADAADNRVAELCK